MNAVAEEKHFQEELNRLDERLRRLQEWEKSASEELKVGWWNQIFQLRKKRAEAADRLKRLAVSDDERAQAGLKAQVEEALVDLKTALETAETRFR